jgi:hypothetical protein
MKNPPSATTTFPLTQPCERQLLAQGSFCMVETCSCGAMHITLGALTLRVSPEAGLEIASTLGDAARVWALRRIAAPSLGAPSGTAARAVEEKAS